MIHVLINGCNGRMGQEVIHTINGFEDLKIIAGFDRSDNNLMDFPVYTNIDNIKEKPDVIIDFSVPISTLNILKYAKETCTPIVIATTGFTEEELNIIDDYSKSIPIFKSANMSFDINIMAKMASELATKLKDTDIEIIETHHNQKIDSPSGTAILLADSINNALDKKMNYEFNRHDKKSKRGINEIGFSNIRGGNIVGEHTIKFFGSNETFEITHTTYSRSVFAEGALKAALFIYNKPTGKYDMNDLI